MTGEEVKSIFKERIGDLTSIGFEVILSESFSGFNFATIEDYVILWHPDGLLASCNSFSGKSITQSKIYYNYQHTNQGSIFNVVSSGKIRKDGLVIGDHPVESGIVETLKSMRAEGDFLSTWVERPHMFLTNYMESKDTTVDSDVFTEERISRFPEHVRNCITPATTVDQI